jgi:hypothetical protein
MPTADGKRLREKVIEGAETVEEEVTGQNEWEVVGLESRTLNDKLKSFSDHAHRPGSIPSHQRLVAEGVQGARPIRDHDNFCRHGICMSVF